MTAKKHSSDHMKANVYCKRVGLYMDARRRSVNMVGDITVGLANGNSRSGVQRQSPGREFEGLDWIE